MTRSASMPFLGSEFDNFLFAPIDSDGKDMPLSVLSALARLDVDPWQEAAKLARLPAVPATERLASMIAALPDGPSADLDPRTTAARLIALLPRGTGFARPSRQVRPDSDAAITSRTVIYVVLMGLVVSAFCIMVGGQAAEKGGGASASAIGKGSPAQPPSRAGE